MANELTIFTCAVCGYRWIPRTADPKYCPGCQTKKWRGG